MCHLIQKTLAHGILSLARNILYRTHFSSHFGLKFRTRICALFFKKNICIVFIRKQIDCFKIPSYDCNDAHYLQFIINSFALPSATKPNARVDSLRSSPFLKIKKRTACDQNKCPKVLIVRTRTFQFHLICILKNATCSHS